MDEKQKITKIEFIQNGKLLPRDETKSIFRPTPYQYGDTVNPEDKVSDSDTGYHYSSKLSVDQFSVHYNR